MSIAGSLKKINFILFTKQNHDAPSTMLQQLGGEFVVGVNFFSKHCHGQNIFSSVHETFFPKHCKIFRCFGENYLIEIL